MPYEAFANQEYRNFFQTRVEIPLLVRALRIPRGLRILEIGCGRGVALPALHRLCEPSALAAVDLDAELVTLARERARRHRIAVDIRVADCRDLPFADATFDLVIDFGTCYHIDAAERALAEVSRVLAVGGSFIHESPVAQLLAHPVRSRRRRLGFDPTWGLAPRRSAILWSQRRKLANPSHPIIQEVERVGITA